MMQSTYGHGFELQEGQQVTGVIAADLSRESFQVADGEPASIPRPLKSVLDCDRNQKDDDRLFGRDFATANGNETPSWNGRGEGWDAENRVPMQDRVPASRPMPAITLPPDEVEWDDTRHPRENYSDLGQSLSRSGCLYRRPTVGGGLIRAAHTSSGRTTFECLAGTRLAAEIVDNVPVRMICNGRVKRKLIPSSHLKTMLESDSFLRHFQIVDEVATTPRYRNDFSLTPPGYSDHGQGERILCLGEAATVAMTTGATTAFLDVMDFATQADRTNTVAAALTVLLRHRWPGAKPLLSVTATKSQAGKETISSFVRVDANYGSISYQETDWALENCFNQACRTISDIGVVAVENARLGNNSAQISSAFLERFTTDPQPLLYSPGSGAAVNRRNDLVIVITTNHGCMSQDLLNRALPIHLAPLGDVVDRKSSPIGDPKTVYLPANRSRIVAELRGMIQRWIDVGCPLDQEVKHVFVDWARTIGGILLANGFRHFLANASTRRTADNRIRQALAILGASHPDEWLRPGAWAGHAKRLGVDCDLIERRDRSTDAGRERGMGVTLTAHQEGTFAYEGENERLVLRLRRERRREGGKEAKFHYRFGVESRERLDS